MKNKPHPRWAQPGSNSELEQQHCRAQTQTADDSIDCSDSNISNASSSPRLADPSPSRASTSAQPLPIGPLSHPFSHTPTGHATLDPNTSRVRNPYHSAQSPLSTASPGIATPAAEFSAFQPSIAGEQQGFVEDFDFASMFMSYPDLMSYNEDVPHTPHHGLQAASILQHNKTRPTIHERASPPEDRHCGCLDELQSYNAMLELSLRLRKAADILSRSANHRMGARCLANQRVADLDAFATYIDFIFGVLPVNLTITSQNYTM